jgi:Spy/CpxP family protein refolding chaperone
MKTRSIISMVVIGMLLFGTVTAFGQMGKRQGQGTRGKQGCEMQGPHATLHEQLDLTADQIKQIQASKTAARKEIIPLKADLKLARLELNEIMRNGGTKAALDQKIDEIGAIKVKIQKIRIGEKLEFRNLLTAEQKEKLDTMPMGKRGGRHGGHGGFHGGFGRGGGDCPRFGDGDPMPDDDI